MNTLPLIFVIWCIMDSEVSGMKKNNMGISEKEDALKLRGRKRRWLGLTIAFAVFAIGYFIRNINFKPDAPYEYSLPFFIPMCISAIMCIAVSKIDTVTKKSSRIIYRLITIFLIYIYLVSFGIIIIYEDKIFCWGGSTYWLN